MCQTCIDDGSISPFLYEVIQAFIAEHDGDERFGNAHIVLDDCNVEDSHIGWCLERMKSSDPKDAEAIPFLRWMLTIPELDRTPLADRVIGD